MWPDSFGLSTLARELLYHHGHDHGQNTNSASKHVYIGIGCEQVAWLTSPPPLFTFLYLLVPPRHEH